MLLHWHSRKREIVKCEVGAIARVCVRVWKSERERERARESVWVSVRPSGDQPASKYLSGLRLSLSHTSSSLSTAVTREWEWIYRLPLLLLLGFEREVYSSCTSGHSRGAEVFIRQRREVQWEGKKDRPKKKSVGSSQSPVVVRRKRRDIESPPKQEE